MASPVLILRTAAWIAAVIYATIPSFWLLIHPFPAFWGARKSPLKLMGLMWLTMWLVVGWITAPFRGLLLYSTPFAILPGGLLLIIGCSIYFSMGEFGFARLSGQPEIGSGKPQRLITTGLHGRVRHPIYLAHLCNMLGCAIASVFAILTGILLIRLEDQELERRFGEEFRDYRTRVPALAPRIH